ncbi:MAG: DUF6263 family protein [Verrucomicrobiota bacterium]
MKKHVLLTTITLALGLSGVGCNKSGKLNTTSKFTAPSGAMELKLKWPVGEHIVQSLDFKMKSEITVPKQPAPIKQDMTMGQSYALSVLKEDADGGHEVEMEFLSMRMKLDQGGKPIIDYDSGKKSPGGSADPMAALFQKTIGAKLQYFLDASNQVQRVEGVDALRARMTTGGPNDPSTIFKNIFSEDYFKQIMDYSRNLPPKPVQPGDTWSVTRDITEGDLGAIVLNYDMTFQRWEQRGKRNCARLEFQGTVKSRSTQNPAPNGMIIAIQEGNTSGVTWFDPELGMFIDTTMNQDMKMLMTMSGRAAGGGGRTITMTNNTSQVITIKLDSVK